MKKLPITGFVLAIEGDSVLLRITGLLSKRDTEWVRRPTNIPKWATFGIGFKAKMPESIKFFSALRDDPSALEDFEPFPDLFLRNDELEAKLKCLPEMTWLELMGWVAAPNTAQRFAAWEQSFIRRCPEATVSGISRARMFNLYRDDLSIAQYWKSPIGRFNRDALRFWMAIKVSVDYGLQRMVGDRA